MKKVFINDKKIFYSGLIYFIMMCVFVGVRIAAQYAPSEENFWTSYGFTLIIQVGIMGLVPFVLYKLLTRTKAKQQFRDFGFTKTTGKTILYAVLLSIAVYICVIFVQSFWMTMLYTLGYPINGGGSSTPTEDTNPIISFLISLVFIAVLPGIFEEFAHRGMVLNSIKQHGVWRAILITALLFALMHLSIVKVGYTFLVGVVLGLVAVITRSIWPCIVIHFTNNAISTYSEYAIANDWFGADLINSFNNMLNGGNFILSFVVIFLVLAVMTFVITFLIGKMFNEGKRQHFMEFKRKMRANLPDDEKRQEFDKMPDTAILELYTQTMVADKQQMLKQAGMTEYQYMQLVNKKGPMFLLLDEKVVEKSKINKLDYLFYYCSIFLGAVVTVMTFLWYVI